MSGDFGIKVSSSGKSVLIAEDNELAFTSKYPSLKIHSEGRGTYTFTNNQGNKLLTTHNLGYRPFFGVWVDYGGSYTLTSCSTSVGDYRIMYTGTATSTQLYLTAIRAYIGGIWGDPTLPPNKEVDYSWIIFYDPINE